jgi:hypothetical protein
MKFTIAILSVLPAVMALPTYQGTPQCAYSSFEKWNMDHQHDVNTGKLRLFGKVTSGFPRLLGAGCSPHWAVGGEPDDETPWKTPAGY